MASFNKVVLLGNLTREPELRYAQDSNMPVVRSAIAVNYKYRDKEETMFIDIIVFGKQAEIFASYAPKGAQILIEGRLSQSTWEQDGQKRSKHEIIINSFQLCGTRNKTMAPSDLPDFDTEQAPF